MSAIAITGIGCRFPGGAQDAPSFWEMLRQGRDAIGPIPPERFDVARWYDERPATPGRVMSRWGGFLDAIDRFDAGFFGISPLEAERLDPQQRLLLETTWEALEDAGIDALGLAGSRTGVFVGQWLSDFEARLFARPDEVDFYMTTGSGRYASSGRISYLLGLEGPSLTLDTACSSSLVAVHLAVQSIRRGESDLALAGAANVILQPHISIAYSQSRMMAADGRCKFCDAAGDGYVRSEGAGVVVLKRLERAQADGDRIYAVIRGSATNNDGRGSGSMGTPSRQGQEALLRRAYQDAGIPASRVGYVEAHGTGTRAGDPVELGALAAVLGEGRPAQRRARIGSVKTNIGHTEAAAGIAGLIKTALALHHREIPPSLHCNTPNPAIPWERVPFEVALTKRPLALDEGPAVAGVSAFGIAGTNAHVVLEQAPARAAVGARTGQPPLPAVLPLSARAGTALRALAAEHARRLEASGSGVALHDWCWTAATRRSALDQRAAFVANDVAGMLAALRSFAQDGAAAAQGTAAEGARPKVAFVVPGQGGQWHGMARELSATSVVFREALERCDAAARKCVDWSICEQIHAESPTAGDRLQRIDVVQPVLVAIAIAYARWLESMGIRPDALVGHSMGEVAAAHLCGALDLDAAMRVVCRRSALMHDTSGQGAMAVIDLPVGETRVRLAGRESVVAVAASNSPRSTVVSGAPEAVRQIVAAIQAEGLFARLVNVDVASHGPQMEPLVAPLVAGLDGMAVLDPALPIYSTVLGRRDPGLRFDATYWGRNLRQPVRFADAVAAMLHDGVSVFVELGPHPLLAPALEQIAAAQGRTVTVVPCGRREESEAQLAMTVVAALWCAGATPAWSGVLPQARAVDGLPFYPWQRERHWSEAADPVGERSPAARLKPDESALAGLHRLEWHPLAPPTAASGPDAAGDWLIVADAQRAESVRAAATAQGLRCRSATLSELPGVLGAWVGDGPSRIVSFAEADDEAPRLPIRVLQAVLHARLRRMPRLWFVTRGAHSLPGAPTVEPSPMQAAVWGAARVVGQEHPEAWGGLVDLDGDEAWCESLPAMLRHLRSDLPDDEVAWRRGGGHTLRLVPHGVDGRATGFAWRADATYLITGGHGAIALHLARTMVEQGARRIVLLGRTALPPRATWSALDAVTTAGRRVAAIRALESLGAAVHVEAVDVSDAAAMQAFVERHRAEGWPAIRGVVHAAGNFDNRLASEMTQATFEGVLGPKLRGALVLDRLFPEVDLFVLMSSAASFLAQPGQANYAAANAGLDAIAAARGVRGQAGLSIAWGVWRGTGLVADAAGAANVAEMERQGLGSFDPATGATMFGWLCGRAERHVALVPLQPAFFTARSHGRRTTLFASLRNGDSAASTGPSLSERLAALPVAQRRAALEPIVREAVGKVLKLAPSRVDPRKSFGSLGLSSLLAMELRNRLEVALARALPATLAWNHPSVEALVNHLADAERGESTTRTDAAPVVTLRDAVELASLSDEEALVALRSGRGRSVH